jgi:hypothetical protein
MKRCFRAAFSGLSRSRTPALESFPTCRDLPHSDHHHSCHPKHPDPPPAERPVTSSNGFERAAKHKPNSQVRDDVERRTGQIQPQKLNEPRALAPPAISKASAAGTGKPTASRNTAANRIE